MPVKKGFSKKSTSRKETKSIFTYRQLNDKHNQKQQLSHLPLGIHPIIRFDLLHNNVHDDYGQGC
jgi:hypothetical protein